MMGISILLPPRCPCTKANEAGGWALKSQEGRWKMALQSSRGFLVCFLGGSVLAGSVRCVGLLQRGHGWVSELGLGSAPLSKRDFQAEGKILHNQGWFSHWVGNGAKLRTFGAQGIVLGFSVLSLPIKLFPFLSLPAVPKTPAWGGCWSAGL